MVWSAKNRSVTIRRIVRGHIHCEVRPRRALTRLAPLSQGDGDVPCAEAPISDQEFPAPGGSVGGLGCNEKSIREGFCADVVRWAES